MTKGKSRSDARRASIQDAAIEQFSERGYAGTSMANIAEAAGVSRPALYQYFENKEDVFAAAFIALFEHHVEIALAALDDDQLELADRLDGFLQRFEGDLWDKMSASPHIDELAGAKDHRLAQALSEVVSGLWRSVAARLDQWITRPESDVTNRRAQWVDLLRLAPAGFRADAPSVEVYRERLSALARSVSADIDSLVD